MHYVQVTRWLACIATMGCGDSASDVSSVDTATHAASFHTASRLNHLIAELANLGMPGYAREIVMKGLVIQDCTRRLSNRVGDPFSDSPQERNRIPTTAAIDIALLADKVSKSSMFADEDIDRRMRWVGCGDAVLVDGDAKYSFEQDEWIVNGSGSRF